MKKLYILALSLASLAVAVTSCSRSESDAEKGAEAKYEVTAADSVQILASTDRIMNLFKDEKIDEAAALLSQFNKADSTLSPVSDEYVQMLQNRQLIFPVKAFELRSTEFEDEYNNAVVYDVFFSLDSLGQPNPDMRTKMAFNMVRKDGTFVPTLKDR